MGGVWHKSVSERATRGRDHSCIEDDTRGTSLILLQDWVARALFYLLILIHPT